MGKSNYPVIYGGDLRKNQCDGVLTPLKSNLNLLMLLQSLEGDASLRLCSVLIKPQQDRVW